MSLNFTGRIALPAIALGLVAAFHAPAYANEQKNQCSCLVTESSPCTCTRNWKISPLATHKYVGTCDNDGDGSADFAVDGYSISLSVKGKDKMTSCGTTTGGATPTPVNDQITDTDYVAPTAPSLRLYRSCTNWNLIKKDSTSTVVTCRHN